MVKSGQILFLCILFGTSINSYACNLEGSGYIKVACSSKDQSVSLEIDGMDLSSIDTLRVGKEDKTWDVFQAKDPNVSDLLSAFERVDENLLTLSYDKFGAGYGYIRFMAHPRSFSIFSEADEFEKRGGMFLNGTFQASLLAVNAERMLEIDQVVLNCTVEILDCKRNPL